MFRYDEIDFRPPAPTIEIRVVSSDSEALADTVRMQLDSGADMTCLPRNLETVRSSRISGSVRVNGYTTTPEYSTH